MRPNTKRVGALLPVLMISMCAVAQQPSDTSAPIHLTLEQVWDKAAQNNKKVQMAHIRVQTSDEILQNAKAERLPELSVNAALAKVTNMPMYEDGIFHSPTQYPVLHNYGKLAGEAYFNIYNGNKTNLEIQKGQTEQAITKEQENLTLSEVKFSAAVCYLDLVRSCQFKELIAKDIEDQQQQLTHIQELQKNGVVLKSDVLRAQLRLSRQQMGMVTIDNDIAIARQRLAILIGDDENERIVADSMFTDGNAIPGAYDEYVNTANANAYQLKISAGESELKKLSLKNVKANVAPKIGLFAEYTYAYPQIQFYPYADAIYGFGMGGVKASFAISSFYHNKHKEKAASLELQREEVAHEETGDIVKQQVKEAYLRYQESLTRIGVAESNIKQATENARIVNNTYFNQLSLVTDLLDADTQLLQTRFDLVSAKIAARVQFYQLQKVIGNL